LLLHCYCIVIALLLHCYCIVIALSSLSFYIMSMACVKAWC